MPSTYTYPGLYVEEIPSGVRTIAGVSTSNTAFIDFFPRGPMNEAVRITGMEDFRRRFGGLHRDSEAGYAISQYFLNGGQIAFVVRAASGTPVAAEFRFAPGGSPAGGELRLAAVSPGRWAQDRVHVAVDHNTMNPGEFNLVVRELDETATRVIASEIHRNLSMNTTSSRFVSDVLQAESELVRAVDVGMGPPPQKTGDDVTAAAVVAEVNNVIRPEPPQPGDPPRVFYRFGRNLDGTATGADDGQPPDADALISSLNALELITPEIFNILCLPRASELGDESAMNRVVEAATKFCVDKRAFLIVDPHKNVDRRDQLKGWLDRSGDRLRHRNAAFYFPRVNIPDPLNEGRPREVGPSGTMAGVYARVDATRGIWKAPAGTDARLAGVELPQKLTDLQHGEFNPLGINILRTFPIFGNIAWGARTLDGADQQASEWKYIPVRRTALYIEESLQALKWVVFEPNDEPLWSQIRLNVGAFMNGLFRQGAFQGTSPREAYFVKCDAETTTQNDIDRGIVNILVGFAPLKPAEFVVIRIQQIAGQIQT